MKIIISWIGFNEDFETRGGRTVEKSDGFSMAIHRDIIEPYHFDKHIILSTSDRSRKISKELEDKQKLLKRFIQDEFPDHLHEIKDSGVDKSDLQDFNVIESSLRSFLQQFDATDELHVVAGTGPTAVGMAWCTLNLAMKNRFGLYVLQRPEYVAGAKRSSLKAIEPVVNQLLDDTLRQHHLSWNLPSEIYKDAIVEEEYKKAMTYAQSTDMSVLILGETGCGKDKMAEFIVKNSPLANQQYKAINCASLPDEVLYSELFGHVVGAFTGASKERIGLFEECNGGTLFLDEIGDITKYMQQSLLRAIENREIKKLGSNDIKKNVKVRIIAATNNNLYEKCKKGEFRWDLYYRLSNPEIILKPYRERTETERKMVIAHFLNILQKKYGRNIKFKKDTQKLIEAYQFPGNFREIYNTLNSLFPLGIDEIEPEHLPARFHYEETQIDETYESATKMHCLKIYKKYKYNLKHTKNALGYANTTQLKDKFIKWGIFREGGDDE